MELRRPLARAEWLRIQRGIFDFQITLAYGRADITPQRPARAAGYKRIDETPRIVASVRHTINQAGYPTPSPHHQAATALPKLVLTESANISKKSR